MPKNNNRNRVLMWVLFAVLVVLHHDVWFWHDGQLLFGFLPIGLAYQIGITLAASVLWGWAAFCAWPAELEGVVSGSQSDVGHPVH